MLREGKLQLMCDNVITVIEYYIDLHCITNIGCIKINWQYFQHLKIFSTQITVA